MTNKELVIERIRELPDGASLDDIAEEVAIMAAIKQGQDDIEAGRFVTHEELKRQVAKWHSE